MRSFINIIAVIVIGLSLGGFSASLALQRSHGIGAVNSGPWSAWPFVGGAEVDPYNIAKSTTDGTLPLGAAEGLAFEATTDSNGNKLQKNCSYQIAGITSTTRLWTLVAYGRDGTLVKQEAVGGSSIHSGNIVRYPDSSFEINVSYSPNSGNWLPISGEGDFKLVLRLYDTPIASNSGIIKPQMPRITLIGCA